METRWNKAPGTSQAADITHLLGVDEAGRGPVIGPLVVAALAVPSAGGEDELRALGVRDSKKLQPAKRERLAGTLASMTHHVIEVPASDVDALRATASLNLVEARIFASACLSVVASLGAGAVVAVYLDAADTSEATFERYFRGAIAGAPGEPSIASVVCRHEADDIFPVVSGASVLAKTRREEAVARIRDELGEDFGSGYPSDEVTQAFLEKWITEKGVLPPHTRMSWKTAQRLIDRHGASARRLDDF